MRAGALVRAALLAVVLCAAAFQVGVWRCSAPQAREAAGGALRARPAPAPAAPPARAPPPAVAPPPAPRPEAPEPDNDPGAVVARLDAGEVDENALRRLRAKAEAAARARQAPVYYLHVHKAGGSTMCATAEASALRTTRERNCNVWDHTNDKQLPFWTWNVADQVALFRDRGLDFVANERGLGAELPPPGDVAYAVTVRDPLNRILSHFRHGKQTSPDLRQYATVADWLERGGGLHAPWANNFLVRTMAPGVGAGDDVTLADLRAARRRLHLFSAVMVLEDYSGTALQLRDKFGWASVDVGGKQRAGTRVDSDMRAALADRPALLQQLLARNRLDYALYEAAKEASLERALESASASPDGPDLELPEAGFSEEQMAGFRDTLRLLHEEFPECIGKLRWYCNSYPDGCRGDEQAQREALRNAHRSIMAEGGRACPPISQRGAIFLPQFMLFE